MRTQTLKNLVVGALLLAVAQITLHAQQFSIDWYKVSGGGGTSTGGVYSVSSTVGQQDAGGPMSGGGYSVTGGFWALYAVQTPGAPSLAIAHSGNSAIVSWLAPATGFLLQTNGNLATSNWVNYGGTIATSNGTYSVTITPPTGKLFFRLANP
jgi:hypothetical protein